MTTPPHQRSRFWLAVLGAWLQRTSQWNSKCACFDIYLGAHFVGCAYFGG